MESPAIAFQHVSKRFRLGERTDSLGDILASALRRFTGSKSRSSEERIVALDDVNFEVMPGEAVGIVGPNGAGKSTALKLIAGILRPNHGHVLKRGRVAALIEVGVGFHGDLTGRENVFLNGAILGMSRREIKSKLDAIVDYAGLDRFLDTPVKRYSSGMYARLGFSIAVHVEPDILLVDEVLAVGDSAFRSRCLDRMRTLVERGTALILVTHDLEQMSAVCDRAIVLESGRIGYNGDTNDAVEHYIRAMCGVGLPRSADVYGENGRHPQLRLSAFDVLDSSNSPVVRVEPRDRLSVALTLEATKSVDVTVELNLRRLSGDFAVRLNSGRSDANPSLRSGPNRIRVDLADLPLAPGHYSWHLRAWEAAGGTCLLDTPVGHPLTVLGVNGQGLVAVDHVWRTCPTPSPDRELAATSAP